MGTDKAGWPGAPEVLTMATKNGAKAMLMDGEIGAIAKGMRADIVLYDLTTPAQLVFCERGQSVRTVIIDGKVVYEDGVFAFGDAAEVGRQAIEMRKKQLGRNENLYRITRRLIAAQSEKMT
jgi:cytosine/adenosine deaminase-related metal-dependent hydrolase